MVPSYRGTPCFFACETGLVQSFVPSARPMKLSTPIGACFGKSVQCMSPALVWMMAAGLASAAAPATGVRTGGLAGGLVASWATVSRETAMKTAVAKKVRMKAPAMPLLIVRQRSWARTPGAPLLLRLHLLAYVFGFTEY